MPASDPRQPAPHSLEPFVAGNLYDKYRTANPLYRRLMSRFLACARELLGDQPSGPVVEVGCGPGDLVAAVWRSPGSGRYVGLDLDLRQVRLAEARTGLPFVAGSAYELPFADGSCGTVIACEVLEHLEDPDRALAEIRRIASGRVLLSVPWEPIWRVLNLARGSYWRRFGNTPGHLQNFSRRRFRSLVARHLEPVEERRPFPWTMLLARAPSR